MITFAPSSEIAAAIQGVRNRLDTLASITGENILVPGGPQAQYYQIVEEAYAALGLIETQVDELRAELEYQHKRLDEVRDAVLAEVIERQE
jgi:prefoldin subunit 5